MSKIAQDILEDSARVRAGDPGRMLERILDLGRQVHDAWARVQEVRLPAELADVQDVTVLGMGGSAIGGDLAAALLAAELRLPMQVHRDYGCPNYIGRRSLVIASSYSGNTEETLSGYAEARRRGARLVALTTGGELAARAERDGVPLVRFAYDAQPRAALGWSLVLVLGVLSRIALVRDLAADVTSALQDLAAYAERFVPSGEDRAKRLARSARGRIAGIYGAGVMGVMARHWKGQWNENAKNWSFFDVLPELDHNAVVGFAQPEKARDALAIILLRSSRDHPRIALRFDVTAELLRRAAIPFEELRFEGANALAEVLQAKYLGDHVSYNLALLNGVDPTPVESIAYLKERLAASD